MNQPQSLMFVYGTLKSQECNHKLLQEAGAIYMGEASIRDNTYIIQVEFGIPYLVKSEPQPTVVKGELYSLISSNCASIDKLETGYVKKEIAVTTSYHKDMIATVYMSEQPLSNKSKNLYYCYDYNTKDL